MEVEVYLIALLGMAEAGEPLLRQALEAIRAYNDATANNRPPAEIERLRLEADRQCRIICGYDCVRETSDLVSGRRTWAF